MGLSQGVELSTGQTVVKVLYGGFSEVGVLQEDGETTHVVKRIKDDVLARSPQVADLFYQECRLAINDLAGAPYVAAASVRLKHLDDLGPVLFLGYVDGPSLADLLTLSSSGQPAQSSMTQTVRVGGQIACALDFAARKGVPHRDLKPSNVLLTRQNEIRVIDWGLSRVQRLGDALRTAHSDYHSRQRRNDPDLVDPADDIYALGVILYRMITGRFPGERDGAEELRRAVKRADNSVPDLVMETVVSMLDDDPTARPTASRVAETFTDETLVAGLASRDVSRPYCGDCRFVAVDRSPRCPVCGGAMYERIPQEPREGMIRVAGGTFWHGLTAEQVRAALQAAHQEPHQDTINQIAPADDPQREAFCHAFDIDLTPVTNEAYERFVRETNYPIPEGLPPNGGQPDFPVVHVTWKDAVCYALSQGKRLPSPMEWERAARGDDKRPYPWGGGWEENRCNHNRQRDYVSTSPVLRYPEGRSPTGVYDMAGNVREWTSTGRQVGMRSVCGGGWTDPVAVYGLVSFRVDAAIDFHDAATGFRCAADIEYEDRPISGGDAPTAAR